MYNIYFYIILTFVVITFMFDKVVAYLNTKNWSETLPKEASDIYSSEEYAKSQKYEKTKYKFNLISSIFSFIVTILVLIFWWFWFLDNILRQFIWNEILLSLSFFSIIFLLQTIIEIPFSYYFNFVIEESFWFNKMTKKLFFVDIIKSLILTFIIWWAILALILFIYSKIWANFWIIAWWILSVFSILMIMFYSSLIVPLFNKQTPLEDWELKTAINEFAWKVGYKLENIYVIDGSKRSNKANAYFSWLGKSKRIVLFDTLINDLTTEEIVWVLAHEIGHYKKKHTKQMLVFSLIQTFVIFYLFSLFISNLWIANALNSSHSSFHLWAIWFSILFSPISLVLGIFGNILSRKNEFEADNYAKINYSGTSLISWLKKLSKNNLTNLKPHKVYEFVHYSHPTVLKRIERLEK